MYVFLVWYHHFELGGRALWAVYAKQDDAIDAAEYITSNNIGNNVDIIMERVVE